MTDDLIIAVDIGNTSIRLGLFEPQGTDPNWQPVRTLDLETRMANMVGVRDWLDGAASTWYIGSVHRTATIELCNWVRNQYGDHDLRKLNHDDLPLSISVPSPAKVGIDRLAAAVAANRLRPADRPAIVVDTGSAITVDVISSDGKFIGGVIMPGMTMSAAALQEGTDQLPFVSPKFVPPIYDIQREQDGSSDRDTIDKAGPEVIGTSTEGAIRSGLIWGAVGSLRFLVQRISERLEGSPLLFFTGGAAKNLSPLVDPDAWWIPNLVLSGIAHTGWRLMSEPTEKK